MRGVRTLQSTVLGGLISEYEEQPDERETPGQLAPREFWHSTG
jgi:hypothetical protein